MAIVARASLKHKDFSDDDNQIFANNAEDNKFIAILAVLFTVYLVIAVAVPFIERLEVSRAIKEKTPAQLTKILLKKKPPPVVKKEQPKPKKKEEKKVRLTKRQKAKEKAQSSGLAAMKNDLLAMQQAFNVDTSVSKPLKKKDSKQKTAAKVERKLITAQANKQTEGVKTQQATQVAATTELSAKTTSKVQLTDNELIAQKNEALGDVDQKANSKGRSEAKIRATLEANKSRLYSLYNRALRKDPFLKGLVVFEIEIQPDGKVSSATIQSSELNNKKLERRLLTILKSINFGDIGSDVVNTQWSAEFLSR